MTFEHDETPMYNIHVYNITLTYIHMFNVYSVPRVI